MVKYKIRTQLNETHEIEADDVNVDDGVANFWKWEKNKENSSVTVFLIQMAQVQWVKRGEAA